jgi:MFS superfamily sulfate permease-like transporter
MNAPPEAHSEYSRGIGAFRRLLLRHQTPSSAPRSARLDAPAGARAALGLAALLGAALIVISQFTALYDLHSATSSAAIKTVDTGPNHAWAPIPLAIVALALAYAVYRHGNRAAHLGLAALGIATLLIVLLGDLSDAHSSGLIGSGASGYVQATSTPSAGLYMETLGAVVLLVTGGVGFLMLGPPKPAVARTIGA